MKYSIFAVSALLIAESCWAAVIQAAVPGADTRNISEIYAAALRENGTLRIAYGGDGGSFTCVQPCHGDC